MVCFQTLLGFVWDPGWYFGSYSVTAMGIPWMVRDFCQVIVSGWFLMDNRDRFGWQHGGCSLAISSSVFNLDVLDLGWHLGFISGILDS